ncbi:MAG TPA: hypothetical protein VIV60_03050 [Polyangiaceae bacterium]
MLRAFSGAADRFTPSVSGVRWQILREQYRRMTQAIRYGDLSEAKAAYDHIRFEQSGGRVLNQDAQIAFDALGDAIESGSLADSSDGLRLLRLVLECTRQQYNHRQSEPMSRGDDEPAETLRSGFVLAQSSGEPDELPETATITDIEFSK